MGKTVYPPGYQGCYRCKLTKPLSEFYPGSPYACKACKCEHVKAWNKDNAEKLASNRLKGIRRNQAFLYEYLNAKACEHCGTDSLLVLELHHIDRSTKVKAVASLVNSGSKLERIKQELTKCIVLCRNCHLIEECRIRYEQGRPDFRYRYQYYGELPSYPFTQQIAKKLYLIEYFKAHPCSDCGETNIVPLQFDHREPDAKYADIGWMLNNRGIEDMKAEISKCDVACANCHLCRTLQRAHTQRYVYVTGKEVNLCEVDYAS